NTPTNTPTITSTPVPGCWTIYPNPNGPFDFYDLRDVGLVSANDIWAVGFAGTAGATSDQAFTEHWNGSQWSVSSPRILTATQIILQGITAVSANDVWAVGTFLNSDRGR